MSFQEDEMEAIGHLQHPILGGLVVMCSSNTKNRCCICFLLFGAVFRRLCVGENLEISEAETRWINANSPAKVAKRRQIWGTAVVYWSKSQPILQLLLKKM